MLPLILKALGRFGADGRFYFLDHLGERPQAQESPQALWREMTDTIIRSRPRLIQAISAAATYDQGRSDLNQAIVGSLSGWWELYVAAWRTGVIGERAKQFSSEIKLTVPGPLGPSGGEASQRDEIRSQPDSRWRYGELRDLPC